MDTTTEQPKTTTEKPNSTKAITPDSVHYGDVNCDGVVDVADAVLLCRVSVEDRTAQVSGQGMKNADCNLDGNSDMEDALMILKYIAKLILYSDLGKK